MSRFYIKDDVFKKTVVKATIGFIAVIAFALILSEL